MAFKIRKIEGLTSAAPVVLGTVGLGASVGVVLGARVRNWSSSAKSAAGTDTAGRIELKDVDGVIFYLDAADRDYATAAVNLTFGESAVVTGLGTTPVDMTGASRVVVVTAVGEYFAGSKPAPVHGPITVTARNFATVTDFLSISLIVEV